MNPNDIIMHIRPYIFLSLQLLSQLVNFPETLYELYIVIRRALGFIILNLLP